jgi:hypothetical protein
MIIVDIEASGLDGYPIEIAWGAIDDGIIGSFLIRPIEAWRSAPWVAEAIHGITKAELAANGVPPREVAEAFKASVEYRAIYSDAPTFDGRWLQMLGEAAGIQLPPVRHIDQARDLILDVSRPQGFIDRIEFDLRASTLKKQAKAYADETSPATHRAGPDVLNLMAELLFLRSRHSTI